MSSPYLICKYSNGTAFYAALDREWCEGGEIGLIHLISGEEFQGNVAYLDKVDPADIPRNYILDTCALNPVLAAVLPPEFRIEWHVEQFGLSQAMQDLAAILKDDQRKRVDREPLEALLHKFTQEQETTA